MEKENDGFEIPIHRSLTEPILMGGVPREIAIINGTMAGAFVLGAQMYLTIPIFIVIHFLAVIATKKDPQFFDAFKRHINHKPFYGA